MTVLSHDDVRDALLACAKDLDVRVLYACESGSRAWGFASEDSDYDARFIFVHAPDVYWQLEGHTENVDQNGGIKVPDEMHTVLDFVGWDVAKALRLLRKSNPSIMEWLSTPTENIYHFGWGASLLKDLVLRSFSPYASICHYGSMAKTTFDDYVRDRDEINIKKLLYVTRSLLCARWAIRHRSQPPVPFEDVRRVLDMHEVKDRIVDKQIDYVLSLKSAGTEKTPVPFEEVEDLACWCANELPKSHPNHLRHLGITKSEPLPWSVYNKVFRTILDTEAGL